LFFMATEIMSMKTASLQEAIAEAVATPQCVGFRRDRDSGQTNFCKDTLGKTAENGRDGIDWYNKELQKDPLCHGPRKWIPYDEWLLPAHCNGYALGPRATTGPLVAKYKILPKKPEGFLDLRNKFNINVAGVLRAGQQYLFPGPDFVIEKGDVALLARVVEPNGNSYPAYEPIDLSDIEDVNRFSAVFFVQGLCSRLILSLADSA